MYACVYVFFKSILGNGKMAHDFWKLRWHKRQKSKKNKMATEYHGRTRCAIYLFHKWGVKWPKTKRQDPVDILLQECAILGVSNPRAANSSFFVPLLLKIQKIQKI
jgi:hypothetical protein